jgi:uncharacterized membrane protein
VTIENHSNPAIDDAKRLIIEVVAKQKPQTTQQLTKIIREKMLLSSDEVSELHLQLEKEGKLNFAKKERPRLMIFRDYLLSRKTLWYLTTVAFSIISVVILFSMPINWGPIGGIFSAIGLIFLLFVPGYALIKLLFSQKIKGKSDENIKIIEKVVLSIALSIALTAFSGLFFNYTPWGIELKPIALSLFAFTIIFATAALRLEYNKRQ